MQEIPVADLNSQAIETVLDGTLFYLVLDWNQAWRYWTIGIRNSAYNQIISGIALVPNYPLTWQFRYPDMPAGELWALSASFRNGPIPRDGFRSGRFKLLYETEQELIDQGLLPLWGRTDSRVV